jgi:mannan endo-1,4-beta-mannosidase
VAATALSATQVQLSWTAPGGQTSYEIRRRTGTGGQYNFNITVSGEAISYEDSGLTPGTTYQYQVRACVESACSDYTNPVTVNTPPSDGG